jgi:putative ABC transport system ATP-binding protein
MIRLDNVTRVYGEGEGGVRALAGVTLELPAGAFVTVSGTSGSGKTTLLNIIGGLDTGYSGAVEVDGWRLAELDDRRLSEYRRRTVGFVFQHFHLLEHFDSLHNVALPALFGDEGNASALRRAAELLEMVGLGDKLHRRPSELSGGQKQRVAIARALFHRPKILLADEPTGNLDTRTGGQIIELFESLNRQGLTVVVVTHEQFLFKHHSHFVRLEDGRIAENGRS